MLEQVAQLAIIVPQVTQLPDETTYWLLRHERQVEVLEQVEQLDKTVTQLTHTPPETTHIKEEHEVHTEGEAQVMHAVRVWAHGTQAPEDMVYRLVHVKHCMELAHVRHWVNTLEHSEH